MSYPAPTGYGTNLACDTSLQRNNDAFLFQLNDGSATTESTLVSPAAITPDGNGNVSLSMIGAPGVGSSTLTFQGSSTAINMTSQGGTSTLSVGGSGGAISVNGNGGAGPIALIVNPGAALTFGNPATTGIAVYQDTTSPGQLAIGNNVGLSKIATFNQTTNNVTLGSLATAGTINLNAATVIKDSVSPTNGLGLSPTGINTSSINQLVATNGILSIGSSLSNATSLQVADLAGDGTVYVRSADGQVPLELRSNNTGSSIIPGTPNTGNITIGSSAANPSGLTITDTATTINKLGGAPQVLLAQGTIAPGGSGNIPIPSGEGLYCIMGCSAGPGSTGQSRQGQFSVMAYVNASARIQMGGSGISDLGSIGGSDSFVLFPNDGLATMFYINNGSQSMVNYSIQAFKISGPIPGAF